MCVCVYFARLVRSPITPALLPTQPTITPMQAISFASTWAQTLPASFGGSLAAVRRTPSVVGLVVQILTLICDARDLDSVGEPHTLSPPLGPFRHRHVRPVSLLCYLTGGHGRSCRRHRRQWAEDGCDDQLRTDSTFYLLLLVYFLVCLFGLMQTYD